MLLLELHESQHRQFLAEAEQLDVVLGGGEAAFVVWVHTREVDGRLLVQNGLGGGVRLVGGEPGDELAANGRYDDHLALPVEERVPEPHVGLTVEQARVAEEHEIFGRVRHAFAELAHVVGRLRIQGHRQARHVTPAGRRWHARECGETIEAVARGRPTEIPASAGILGSFVVPHRLIVPGDGSNSGNSLMLEARCPGLPRRPIPRSTARPRRSRHALRARRRAHRSPPSSKGPRPAPRPPRRRRTAGHPPPS